MLCRFSSLADALPPLLFWLVITSGGCFATIVIWSGGCFATFILLRTFAPLIL
jgi:hypothetical protein